MKVTGKLGIDPMVVAGIEGWKNALVAESEKKERKELPSKHYMMI